MPFFQDDIYRYFKNEIETNANLKIEALQEEIETIKLKQLGIIDEEIHDGIYKALENELNEMNLDYSATLNRIKLASNKETIKRKRDLLDSVLLEVKNKCIKFVNTKEYIKRMEKLIQKIDKDFCGESILFRVKQKDKVIKDIVKENFKHKYNIEDDPGIKIGGFIAVCVKKGILTDQTIDSKLEEKRNWLHQNIKLAIKK
ncbi:hypothetical protein RJI07_04730 [Mycoplasmatota bacterium WC30]